MFSKDKSLRITAYKRFISTEEPVEIIQHYSKDKVPSILGSEKFIKWVKDRYPKKVKEKEIPESKNLCPEVSDIKRAVCNYYKIEHTDLLKSRRGGVENEARDFAIYMLRVIRGERLITIGQKFNLNNYSSVSTAIEKIRRKLKKISLKNVTSK